jgi:hypothetical protein
MLRAQYQSTRSGHNNIANFILLEKLGEPDQPIAVVNQPKNPPKL